MPGEHSGISPLTRKKSKARKLLMLRITFRHSGEMSGEHSGISPLTGKKSKARKTTAVKDHMLFWDHLVSLDDCKMLTSSNSEFHLKIKESLLISHDKLN